jgi:hypothetical protein
MCISADIGYEIRNGFLGMMRDVVLRLCCILGMENGLKSLSKASKIRMVGTYSSFLNPVVYQIFGMCLQQFLWRTHSFFLNNRIRFFGFCLCKYISVAFFF